MHPHPVPDLHRDRDPEDGVSTRHTVRVNLYRIVDDAVERGIAYGLNRAFKHVDSHTLESFPKDDLVTNVMNELCETIEFNEPNEKP